MIQMPRVEIRAAPEGSKSPGIVTGIAAPYDEWADIGGMFREKYAPGAFRARQPENQFAYRNHNWDEPLGSTKANTLRFFDSPEGLRFELELPDTTVGRDFAVLISRGDVQGASLGFRTRGEEWRFAKNKDESDERVITDAEVYEVSLTHIPAYEGTTAALRNMNAADATAVHAEARSKHEAELAARERESVLLSLISRS